MEIAKRMEADAEASQEPWKVLVHRKLQPDWFPYDPKTMRKADVDGGGSELAGAGGEEGGEKGGGEKKVWRLVSWNVNGLRALLKGGEGEGEGEGSGGKSTEKGKGKKKGGRGAAKGKAGGGEEGESQDPAGESQDQEVTMAADVAADVSADVAAEATVLCRLAERERADVVCLQETKLQEKDVGEIQKALSPSFPHSFWSCSTAKLGYSGTAVLSKVSGTLFALLLSKGVGEVQKALSPSFPHSFWSCSTAKLGYSGTAVLSKLGYSGTAVLSKASQWDLCVAVWKGRQTGVREIAKALYLPPFRTPFGAAAVESMAVLSKASGILARQARARHGGAHVRYGMDKPEHDKEGRVVTVGYKTVTVDFTVFPFQVPPLSVRYGMDRPEHDKEGRVVSPLSVRYGIGKPEHDKEGRVVTVESCHGRINRFVHVPISPTFQVPPLSVRYGINKPEHDKEGRVVTVEFAPFFLVCCYTPNSSEKLVRLDCRTKEWDDAHVAFESTQKSHVADYRTKEWDVTFGSYVKELEHQKPVIELEKQKPVVVTGDLNCAFGEIDIFHPEGNRRSSGFTDEERASFAANLLGVPWEGEEGGEEGKGGEGGEGGEKGWRLDYFLVSQSLASRVHDSYTMPDVPGSDHCPLGLILKM
ncbi:unnamed protein product [Closterium sp. NIES-65]|nr:unnamed protein product [Closterium sp. NIES-65]